MFLLPTSSVFGTNGTGEFSKGSHSHLSEFWVWSRKKWKSDNKRVRVGCLPSLYMLLVSKRLSHLFIYVITTFVSTCILLLLIWSGSAPAFRSKKKKVEMPNVWDVLLKSELNHETEFQSTIWTLKSTIYIKPLKPASRLKEILLSFQIIDCFGFLRYS